MPPRSELDRRLTRNFGLHSSKITASSLHRIPVKKRLHLAESVPYVTASYRKPLLVLLDDKNPKVRYELAESLGRTRENSALGPLLRLAKDPSPEVRSCVAFALQLHGSKRAFKMLSKLLLDRDPKVQAAALSAYTQLLARHPNTANSVIQAVEVGLTDRDADVRKAAQAAVYGLRTIHPTIKLSLYPGKKVDLLEGFEWRSPRAIKDGFYTVRPSAKVIVKSQQTGAAGGAGKGGKGGKGGQGGRGGEDPYSGGNGGSGKGEGGGAEPPLAPPPQEPRATPQIPKRNVNTWFEGHDDPQNPLLFEQVYRVGIQVSPDLKVGTFTRGSPRFTEPTFGGQEQIEVIVAVVSDDFRIQGKAAQRMVLPRNPTLDSQSVYFEVAPIKNNQEVFLSVLFYYGNSLFHEAQVGCRVQVMDPKPSDMAAYFTTSPLFDRDTFSQRDLNIQLRWLVDGFRLIVLYDFGGDDFQIAWCTVPTPRHQIANVLGASQDYLRRAVKLNGILRNGEEGQVFYDGEPPELPSREGRLPDLYHVDDSYAQAAFQLLARAGRSLFVNLFYPTAGTSAQREQVRQVGELLNRISQRQRLRIQVVAEQFFIPWNLLYDGQYPDKTVDPHNFWGFKHVIEEIPVSTESPLTGGGAAHGARVRLGMNVNKTAIRNELTSPQLSYAKKLEPGVQVYERFDEEEVLTGLAEGICQLEYFYCHAGIGDEGVSNVDQAYLGLTGQTAGLTLEDIKLATAGRHLADNAMIILNACDSARMDGRFYDGFVPRLLTNGASVVVGSDAEIPSLFGAHLGLGLLDAILKGEPTGDALLRLRQDFLDRYQNPLALIYRVFGNVDAKMPQWLER